MLADNLANTNAEKKMNKMESNDRNREQWFKNGTRKQLG